MRKPQVCSAVCCVILLLACAADYGFGKLPVPRPHRLPVETFPTTIGQWHAGPLLPVDPDVQAMLPTAKIVERIYTDDQDHSFDLTLVTAKEGVDIHDPSVCLPGQGWKINDLRTAYYGSQLVNVADMSEEGDDMRVLYWWTGYYPPPLSHHPWVQAAAHLRVHLVHLRDAESLMVRILSNSANNNDAVMDDFAKSVLPEVANLTAKGRQST